MTIYRRVTLYAIAMLFDFVMALTLLAFIWSVVAFCFEVS